MAEKKLDLSKSVFELCKNDPEAGKILAELGFTEITKPGMLQSVGRLMTIPKGAAMRNVELGVIKQTFEKQGYTITGGNENE
ncbi:MAG: hypothetical protein K0R19_2224 [Bacillota bacterium]|nr:hypothetical protein [Bacillota bacterium]